MMYYENISMFWIGAFWSRLFVLFIISFHPSCWSSSWGEYMLPLKNIWMIWRCSCCSMDRPRVFTTWALPPRRCHKRNVTSKKQPSTIFMLLVSRLDVMAVPCHKPHQAITGPIASIPTFASVAFVTPQRWIQHLSACHETGIPATADD